MAALISWKQPRAVTEREWQRDGAPTSKELLRAFWKWTPIIGLPALVAIGVYFPDTLGRTLLSLLVLMTVIPLLLIAQVWLPLKIAGRSYGIDRKGVFVAFGSNAVRYTWREIEGFCFDNYADVSRVRVLRLTIRRNDHSYERELHFAPDEVDEAQLEGSLRDQLGPRQLR